MASYYVTLYPSISFVCLFIGMNEYVHTHTKHIHSEIQEIPYHLKLHTNALPAE